MDSQPRGGQAWWKERARRLRVELYTLYLAYRDPRTPWYAKAWAAVVIGYACSPLDLIPDFIPLLGYLDDVVLIPLGIALGLKLIPPAVLATSRAAAETGLQESQPVSWLAGVVVVSLWLLVAALIVRAVWRARHGGN